MISRVSILKAILSYSYFYDLSTTKKKYLIGYVCCWTEQSDHSTTPSFCVFKDISGPDLSEGVPEVVMEAQALGVG